jgi:hypothetical protein
MLDESSPGTADKAKSDKRYRSGDAQGLKNADLNPGWIELVPCQSMPRRSRVRVMIIVPTFSERDEVNPPVVTGIVPCQETARAPHVSHRVHHPRAMVNVDGERPVKRAA